LESAKTAIQRILSNIKTSAIRQADLSSRIGVAIGYNQA
jgi:hypothetical protein